MEKTGDQTNQATSYRNLFVRVCYVEHNQICLQNLNGHKNREMTNIALQGSLGRLGHLLCVTYFSVLVAINSVC